jgi:hypothetical protein
MAQYVTPNTETYLRTVEFSLQTCGILRRGNPIVDDFEMSARLGDLFKFAGRTTQGDEVRVYLRCHMSYLKGICSSTGAGANILRIVIKLPH